MPRQSPVVNSVARLRRPYTGEPQWAVEPEVGAQLSDLSPLELAQLLGHAPGPIPDRVRRVVLPDALGPAQQSLEAAVFDAASTLARPVFWMIQPRPDQIRLSLLPDVAAELVQALYSRIPGLIARPIGVHVFLAHGPATVILSGIGAERWTALMDDLSVPTTPAPPSSTAQARSALLRRCCLFPVPPRVESDELRWQDGPTAEWVAAALAHPVAGLSFALPWKLVSESPAPALHRPRSAGSAVQ